MNTQAGGSFLNGMAFPGDKAPDLSLDLAVLGRGQPATEEEEAGGVQSNEKKDSRNKLSTGEAGSPVVRVPGMDPHRPPGEGVLSGGLTRGNGKAHIYLQPPHSLMTYQPDRK